MDIEAIANAIEALGREEKLELFARLALRYPDEEWNYPRFEDELRAAKSRANDRPSNSNGSTRQLGE